MKRLLLLILFAAVTNVSLAREVLSGDRVYYIATTGSDAADCSSSNKCRTPQHLWDLIRDTLDLAGYTVTVYVADGYYAGTTSFAGFVPGARGPAAVVFVGNTISPQSVYLDGGSGDAVQLGAGTGVTLRGFGFQGYRGIVSAGGVVYLGQSYFGPCVWAHLQAVGISSSIQMGYVPYTIGGGAGYHVLAERGSEILILNSPGTLTATLGFTAFAHVNQGAKFDFTGTAYTGAATGKKFDLRSNGVISSNGQSEDMLPGNSAGTKQTGGQYVTVPSDRRLNIARQ